MSNATVEDGETRSNERETKCSTPDTTLPGCDSSLSPDSLVFLRNFSATISFLSLDALIYS